MVEFRAGVVRMRGLKIEIINTISVLVLSDSGVRDDGGVIVSILRSPGK